MKNRFYKKVPEVIEAVQFTGDNVQEIVEFTAIKSVETLIGGGLLIYDWDRCIRYHLILNGYIVKCKKEFFCCDENIFWETYTQF